MNELMLVESRSMRNENVGRVEVLVGFGFQPSGKYYTKDQIATFFQVSIKTIESLVDYHRDEFELDGLRKITYQELKENPKLLETLVGCEISPNGYLGFTEKCIVRTAMLLTQSEVAKQIRTKIIEYIEKQSQSSIPQEYSNNPLILAIQQIQNLAVKQLQLEDSQKQIQEQQTKLQESTRSHWKRTQDNQQNFLMKVESLEDRMEKIEEETKPIIAKRENIEVIKKVYYEEDYYTVRDYAKTHRRTISPDVSMEFGGKAMELSRIRNIPSLKIDGKNKYHETILDEIFQRYYDMQ